MSTPDESAARETALAYLYERINYERWAQIPYQERHFKLERMRKLLEPLGNPHQQLRVVHIAGTKGKGSTAALVASMLTAAGYRTGLYTSPHLERLEERFAIDGQSCSTDELVALVGRMRAVLEADSRRARPAGLEDATYFELTTAMAMLHFVQRQVDLAVLEVGLGGRLDSTNVCQPVVTAITSISYDHQRQLGSTLPEIAGEKAGILKPGIPVICGVREPSAQRVVRARARELDCPLSVIDQDFGYRFRWQQVSAASDPTGSTPASAEGRLDFWRRTRGESPPANGRTKGTQRLELEQEPGDAPDRELLECLDLRLGLLGEHQALNAAVGLAIVDQLESRGWPIGEPARRWGLAEVKCPARVEIVGQSPTTIVDAAHNVASSEALVATLRSAFPGRSGTLVFATSEDKDASGMLRVLLPCFRHAILTRFADNPRCRCPEDLLRRATEVCGEFAGLPVSLSVAPDALGAWNTARSMTPPDQLLCITGSFFLAAELRRVALAEGGPAAWRDPVGA